ncbi:MAG: Hercynine oxygenase [bacterium]|nr:Hercynine oxygenase [bacterium]
MSAMSKILRRAGYLPAAWLLLFTIPAAAQPQIRSTKLSDGVERWYRDKATSDKPWFFEQVENLYRVVLPPRDRLPFNVSVAFLVGVSRYDYLRPQLPFVANDLADMREFLLNQGGFDTVYVVANQVATPGLVENYMTNRFRRSLSARDRLLFYYSGHGADLGGSTGYIQFSKAIADDFANHVLPIDRCMEWSRIIKASHILFVYDCCASGLAFGAKSGGEAEAYAQILSALSRNGSRMVITAGTANEKTYEVPRPGGRGNGVFTRAFLNAAASFQPGPQQAGFVTINQIFAQAEIGVKNFAAIYRKSLSPRRWDLQEDEYRGTFVFVNPNATNPVLPAEYAQALGARARGPAVAVYGMVRLISFITGQVYIDNELIDEITTGEAKDYTRKIGSHQIEVRGASETQKATFTIAQGQTTEVTLRPSIKAPTVPRETSREPTKGPPEGMVLIPAGSFLMGSEDGDSDEKPVHEVYVDAFYLDQYEVTVAQYQSYLRATGRPNPGNWDEQLQNLNHPVVYVSWEDDATNYAQWAGKRLPTEAEWEYAARGGNTGMAGNPKYQYPWGNVASQDHANYSGVAGKDKWERTSPVGSFPPNGFGLYDMAGNVWEWCSDWHAEDYYSKSPKQNPKGPVTTGGYRVLRGGSWDSNPQNVRCANRNRYNPPVRNYSTGFRCAQDAR